MQDISIANVYGESGIKYEYAVYDLSVDIPNDVQANFIYAKECIDEYEVITYDIIYVGITGDLDSYTGQLESIGKTDCCYKHGANCILIHENNDADSRGNEKYDIIKLHKPPCNDKRFY